jgi:phosphate acetyltransferase
LTTVSLGLVRALDQRGVRVAFCKPIGQPQGRDQGPERSTHFVRETMHLKPAETIPLDVAAHLVSEGGGDELMSRVLRSAHESVGEADVLVVEGLVPTTHDSLVGTLNVEMARTLSAEVILVASAAGGSIEDLADQLEFAAQGFGGTANASVAGCILNRGVVPEGSSAFAVLDRLRSEMPIFRCGGFDLIGFIPGNVEFTRCRTKDVAAHLNAEVLSAGDMDALRVRSFHLLARTVPNMLHTFAPGALLVTPGDRSDVLIAVAMAALNHVPIAGLILSGGTEINPRIQEFIKPGLAAGLPLLRVPLNSYQTAVALNAMSSEVPIDDLIRITRAMEYVANHLDAGWLQARCEASLEARMSPAAFCYMLTERARAADRRILLPEGSEPRTIRAAAICHERGIARCALIGNPDEIRAVARGQDVHLPPALEIIDADAARAGYVDALVEMRRQKGLSANAAADQLTDNVMLGTVMLALGEADGLVSGAVHSSANTIRPALQIIKTKPGASVVSSIFFMCLPEQVLVYGDCAVNADPPAEVLADIAIQSADSARAFGIEPRVAMISYSTGESGSGAQVDKVREATAIAKAKRPDLLLDGPLQYDAAAIPDVAATKAPNSPVAGHATVFVFPDLNTGNTTYKAVQRSANVISIGPMLQGLKRPVNDLSRGALVEDIIYTIALTAIQAAQA